MSSPTAACQGSPQETSCRELFRELKNPYYFRDTVALTQTTGWQRRVDALPNVPTFAELGIRNIDAVWVGVIAPRNLPPAIVEYLNDQLAQAVQTPDVRSAFEAAGRSVAPGSPREMTATIEAEIPRWRAVIRQAGIAPE